MLCVVCVVAWCAMYDVSCSVSCGALHVVYGMLVVVVLRDLWYVLHVVRCIVGYVLCVALCFPPRVVCCVV